MYHKYSQVYFMIAQLWGNIYMISSTVSVFGPATNGPASSYTLLDMFGLMLADVGRCLMRLIYIQSFHQAFGPTMLRLFSSDRQSQLAARTFIHTQYLKALAASLRVGFCDVWKRDFIWCWNVLKGLHWVFIVIHTGLEGQ